VGLDMYLTAKKSIYKVDWHKDIKETILFPQYTELIRVAGLTGIANQNSYGAEVSVSCAYWRKANQIHAWFVHNVQNDVDECEEHFVSREKLDELLATCKEVLDTKDSTLLEPSGGCFFGNTEINEYYWNDIENTIEQLERILAFPDIDNLTFSYQSSW